MKHRITVREWDEGRARAKSPMEILGVFDLEGPALSRVPGGVRGDVDGLDRQVRLEVARRYRHARVRSLLHCQGGGVAVTVDR